MSNQLTSVQWEWLERKYGNLLHHIAYRIGGDSITNDHDDSYQELSIAVLDTVAMFDRTQTIPFDEYKLTKGFDKYVKTVLWNRKNNLGGKIVKRAPLRRQVTIDEQILKDKVNEPVESFKPFGNETLDTDLQQLVNEVVLDARIIKPSGDFNLSRLCRRLGKPKSQIKFMIQKLQKTLEPYNESE
jgi:hypothetical protein